jgi:hypothetical protein
MHLRGTWGRLPWSSSCCSRGRRPCCRRCRAARTGTWRSTCCRTSGTPSCTACWSTSPRTWASTPTASGSRRRPPLRRRRRRARALLPSPPMGRRWKGGGGRRGGGRGSWWRTPLVRQGTILYSRGIESASDMIRPLITLWPTGHASSTKL